jgi:hypothetical protein
MKPRHSFGTVKVWPAVARVLFVLVATSVLVWALPRAIAFAAALVLLLLDPSPSPWLIVFAGLGVLGGFTYLFQKTARERLRADEDFAN